MEGPWECGATLEKVARVTGLEPATSGVTGRHSNQLSYTRNSLARRGPGRPSSGGALDSAALTPVSSANVTKKATKFDNPAYSDNDLHKQNKAWAISPQAWPKSAKNGAKVAFFALQWFEARAGLV